MARQNDNLVKVVTTTGTHNLWYGILKKIPSFSDKLKETEELILSLPITSDELWYLFEIYSQGLDTSDINLSEWKLSILKFKCGISSKNVLSKFKLQPIPNLSLDNFNRICCSSGYITMAAFSEVSDYLSKIFPENFGNIYGYMGPETKTSAFIECSLRPKSKSETKQFGTNHSYNVSRAGEMVTYSIFRAILPPLPKGCKWKSTIYRDLIKNITLRMNELIITDMSGSQNFTEIQTSGLFSKLTHNYHTLSEQEQFLASQTNMYISLPLMLPWNLDKKSAWPVCTTPYNECIIGLTIPDIKKLVDGYCPGIEDLEFIDSCVSATYVMMNNDIRHNMGRLAHLRGKEKSVKIVYAPTSEPENEKTDSGDDTDFEDDDDDWVKNTFVDDKPTSQSESNFTQPISNKNKINPYSFHPPFDFQYTFIQTNKAILKGSDQTTEVALHFSKPVTTLILNFKSSIGDTFPNNIIFPFTDVVLFYENTPAFCWNAIDARDFLWRKCGRKPPKSGHSFLLPLTPDAFNKNVVPSCPDFSKLNSVRLVFSHNSDWIGEDWDIEISAYSYDIVRVAGGSMGKPFM